VVVSYITDPDICFVGTDHQEGGFIATEHLVKSGYRKIGYINGEKGNLCGEERKNGYLKALKKHTIPINEKYEYRLPLGGEWNDFRSGYKIGKSFLQQSEKPEAVFAYNDLVALGFQKAILEGGLKIPQDVAIVGFDNIDECSTAAVPLTTINQPTDKIGNIAVDVLYRKCRGEEVDIRYVLKPQLVVRESSERK
jgi:DNA-binding LacI/PurR family transcriptional regulator